jgi:acetyl esterase
VATVRDLAFDGPDGSVAVRTYRPEAAGPVPTVVFFHGGGFVVGTLDSADDLARRLAVPLDALVISVEYRLGPKHPFPAAVDDADAAVRWVEDVVPVLGDDPDRLTVASGSAGGALATATALACARPMARSVRRNCCCIRCTSRTRPSQKGWW